MPRNLPTASTENWRQEVFKASPPKADRTSDYSDNFHLRAFTTTCSLWFLLYTRADLLRFEKKTFQMTHKIP